MVQFLRSIKKSIHVLLLCAFALSSGAPAQAMGRQRLQGAGESISSAASRARSAMVGGARYSAAWINRQIESGTTNIPLWGYRRIAGVFRRFAKPDRQELQVMKKWMNRQPLSEQEQTVWSAYKKRVYSSRGAIAAIATVVIAILAAAAGIAVHAYKKKQDDDDSDDDDDDSDGFASGDDDDDDDSGSDDDDDSDSGTGSGSDDDFAIDSGSGSGDDDDSSGYSTPTDLKAATAPARPSRPASSGSEDSGLGNDGSPIGESLAKKSQEVEDFYAGLNPKEKDEFAKIAAYFHSGDLIGDMIPIQQALAREGLSSEARIMLEGQLGELQENLKQEELQEMLLQNKSFAFIYRDLTPKGRAAKAESVAAEMVKVAGSKLKGDDRDPSAGAGLLVPDKAVQEDERLRAEAGVKRDLEQEETIGFFEQFLSPEAAEREAQEQADRAQAAADAEAAVAAATVAVDERARAVAAAGAARLDRVGKIVVTPASPTDFYPLQLAPQEPGEAPPAELVASIIDIQAEIGKLSRNLAMHKASEKRADEYQRAMQAWGRRWESINPKPEHQQEVYNVAKWLLEAESDYATQQILTNLRGLNEDDRAFLGRFIEGTPLASKLKRIAIQAQRAQQARQHAARGQQQKARVMGAGAPQSQPDRGILGGLVDSLLGTGAGAGAGAAAAAAGPRVPFITQWGRVKASIDRYLRQARRNILQGKATDANFMDQLRGLQAALSTAELSAAEIERIKQDLDGYIGAGNELKSLMTDIMRVGGGTEVTPDSMRVMVDANFQAIPQVFKDAPHNLTPETLYTFLEIPQNTTAANMRGAVLRKIAVLRRAGVDGTDLNWLQRQLMYYTDQYEKDRFDAALGDAAALVRLQQREAVQLDEAVKGQQEDNVMSIMGVLDDMKRALLTTR